MTRYSRRWRLCSAGSSPGNNSNGIRVVSDFCYLFFFFLLGIKRLEEQMKKDLEVLNRVRSHFPRPAAGTR